MYYILVTLLLVNISYIPLTKSPFPLLCVFVWISSLFCDPLVLTRVSPMCIGVELPNEA